MVFPDKIEWLALDCEAIIESAHGGVMGVHAFGAGIAYPCFYASVSCPKCELIILASSTYRMEPRECTRQGTCMGMNHERSPALYDAS